MQARASEQQARSREMQAVVIQTYVRDAYNRIFTRREKLRRVAAEQEVAPATPAPSVRKAACASPIPRPLSPITLALTQACHAPLPQAWLAKQPTNTHQRILPDLPEEARSPRRQRSSPSQTVESKPPDATSGSAWRMPWSFSSRQAPPATGPTTPDPQGEEGKVSAEGEGSPGGESTAGGAASSKNAKRPGCFSAARGVRILTLRSSPSPLTSHLSPITNHPSPITHHPSPFTLHPSLFTLHPYPHFHPHPHLNPQP